MIYEYIGKQPFCNHGQELVSPHDIIESYIDYGSFYNHTKKRFFIVCETAFNTILNDCIINKAVCKNSAELSNKTDKVNHPAHYTWLKDKCGIEVIDITRHMDFDLGNALKYILRCGHKSEQGYSDKDKAIEDLKKAIFYINDKIKVLSE